MLFVLTIYNQTLEHPQSVQINNFLGKSSTMGGIFSATKEKDGEGAYPGPFARYVGYRSLLYQDLTELNHATCPSE